MYWRIIVLQDTYKKYMGIESKCATRKAQQKQIKREAHIPCKFGPTTNETTLWAHPGSNHAKAVASEANPRPHHPHLLSGPPLIGDAIMAARVGSCWLPFLSPLKPTKHMYKRRVRVPSSQTQLKSLSPSTCIFFTIFSSVWS